MKVILKKDIDNLGHLGDVKEVAEGYARNYLFHKGLVLEATESNLNNLKKQKELIEKKKSDDRLKVKELADGMSKLSINIPVSVGETGKLFGVITKDDIAKAFETDTGKTIDKHDIILDEPIKEIGVYTVEMRIRSEKFPDQKPEIAKIKVWVVQK